MENQKAIKKTQMQQIDGFEKWMEKINNVHRGNNEKMSNAYQQLLKN